MRSSPVIYLDILLAVNLCMNFLLLFAAGQFLGFPCRKWRLLLGAAGGAAASLMILLPVLPLFTDLLLKIPVSAGMVWLAYPLHSWRDFIKGMACLYGISFAFAGILMAISACFHPSGLVLKNSAIYVAISPLFLLGTSVMIYFLIKFLYRIVGHPASATDFCTMELWYKGKYAKLQMKIDTGNQLREPFSGVGVAVVDANAADELLHLDVDSFTEWNGVRMIPCHTVAGTGLMPAVRPDRCRILWNQHVIETTTFYLAVSNEPIVGGFQGLLNPMILNTGTTHQKRIRNQGRSNDEAYSQERKYGT